jgi:hypothetical protein
LLARSEGRFDVFVTMDAGLAHQHNLASQKIAVLILRAHSNRLADTRPLMPEILKLLENVRPGSVTMISP